MKQQTNEVIKLMNMVLYLTAEESDISHRDQNRTKIKVNELETKY